MLTGTEKEVLLKEKKENTDKIMEYQDKLLKLTEKEYEDYYELRNRNHEIMLTLGYTEARI